MFPRGYDGNKVSDGYNDGLDTAGLFKDVTWNNNILYTASSPFAMDDDIVGDSSKFTVDTHWTMSCGNDPINGNVLISRNDTQIPDLSVSMLFGPGFLGLFALQLVEGEKNHYKLDLIQKERFPRFFLFGYLLI